MNIDNIVQKVLLGQADRDELAALERWKNESKENLMHLNQLQKIQQVSDNLSEYSKVDAYAAWSKLENSLDTNTERSRLIQVGAIALLLLFLLSIGYVVYQKYFHKSEETYIANGISEPIFNMSDGSVLDLDKDAILTQTGYRAVSLEGKAYFKIAKDKSHPFTVKTNHGVLTVLGTEFNIVTSEKNTQVYVAEGKVSHDFNGKNYTLVKDNVLELKAGEVTLLKGNYSYLSAWKNGVLKFENASLHEVMDAISAFYGVSVVWQTQKVDNCKINTVISNEKVEDVIKELTLISGLKTDYIKGKIIVKSFKCQ